MAIRIAGSGSVTLKAAVIGVIVMALLIPLSMLRGLVKERTSLREEAYAKVAEGWGGSQVLGGPMLILPTERVIAEGQVTRVVRQDLYLLPARLEVDIAVQLESQPRTVGIYAVPVYLATTHLVGKFDFKALADVLQDPGRTYLWEQARLHLPLSQVGSLREVRQALFAEQEVRLGPAGSRIHDGVEARVAVGEAARSGEVPFEFTTVLAGSREISVLPLGSLTSVVVRSDWPHPSFNGAFLPAERTINDEGFEAKWQVLELNRPYRQAWLDGEVEQQTLSSSALGVGLYQAVDIYQRGERAVKYALLFIALTFLTFFAWEQLSGMRLHPLQYLLVGLALSTFYLLLIALSEHVAFAIAYLCAAAALILLIGSYVAGIRRDRTSGSIASGVMTVVYGLLYILVLSEDYALLLGAIILFAALAGVMLATRHVDWYEVSRHSGSGS